jgi:hypothetical protein
MCPDLSLPQPSNWQGPKQRSLEISARVPFATFRSNLSSGLNCWVHSHRGCEPVTSTRGLCHGKKSEQAGCIASAQTRRLCHGKKSVRAECIPFAQTRGLCHDKKQSKQDASLPLKFKCHTLRRHIKQILRHQVAFLHFSWLSR